MTERKRGRDIESWEGNKAGRERDIYTREQSSFRAPSPPAFTFTTRVPTIKEVYFLLVIALFFVVIIGQKLFGILRQCKSKG